MVGYEQAQTPPVAELQRDRALAGQPPIRGTVTWMLAYRSIVIAGRRGGEAFEEVVA